MDSFGKLSFTNGIPTLYIDSKRMVHTCRGLNTIPSKIRIDGVEYTGDSVFQILEEVYDFSYIDLPQSKMYLEWNRWKEQKKIEENV